MTWSPGNKVLQSLEIVLKGTNQMVAHDAFDWEVFKDPNVRVENGWKNEKEEYWSSKNVQAVCEDVPHWQVVA